MSTPRECSVEAFNSITPAGHQNLLGIVYCAIRDLGGLTDEEGQDMTGVAGNSWRPARKKLQEDGLIGFDGHTRPTKSGRKAIVWTVR